MTHHALAVSNLLTFLLTHHAEDILAVAYGPFASVVTLRSPPKGATMLSWEWEQSQLHNQMTHRTESGITVFAPSSPTSQVSA